MSDRLDSALGLEADAGTRTPDPLLTMEVLYRLSYVGVGISLLGRSGGSRIRTCVGSASAFTARFLWPLGHPPEGQGSRL